jgi:hypothetical protein
MGAIAPIFSAIGSIVGAFGGMGGGGQMAAPAPPQPIPPPPQPTVEPEGAADAEVAKRRSLARKQQRQQETLLGLESATEEQLNRKTLIGTS